MNESSISADSETINLLDYLKIILKHKKVIISITITSFVVSFAVSHLLPTSYTSATMILPPQQDQGLMGLLMGSTGGGMASIAGDLLGKGSPADMYVSILNSNVISDSIIDRFKLMEVYGQKYRLDTYKVLDKKVDISAGKKDGIITIAVEDREPKRAADMANAYVEELSSLTVKLNITGAGQNRVFLEDRLVKAKADLAHSEEVLKQFQLKNKTLDILGQAKATIEGVAQLRAQLAMQEIQLETLRHQYTDASQEVKTLKTTIGNLKSQIARLEGSNGGGSIPSIGSVPTISQEYMRLMREFKVQEAIVELLTKQYEVTKLSEAKDVSSIQVIQKARVPDRKSKPKRSVIILMATMLAFVGSVAISFLLEYIANMPETERLRWREIKLLACEKLR